MSERTSESCERVRERLEGLLLGELDPLERARDEGHLEACDPCRREVLASRRLLGALHAPHTDLAYALRGLHERLARTTGRTRKSTFTRGAAFHAVLTVAAALLALLAIDAADLGGVDIRKPEMVRLDALDDVWRRGIEPLREE